MVEKSQIFGPVFINIWTSLHLGSPTIGILTASRLPYRLFLMRYGKETTCIDGASRKFFDGLGGNRKRG
jgi:hypothetical protein